MPLYHTPTLKKRESRLHTYHIAGKRADRSRGVIAILALGGD